MSRKRLFGAGLALLLILAAGGYFLLGLGRSGDENGLTLYGNVEMRQVDLGFRVSGRLQESLVEEGDRVRAGALLARLDRQPFADALAQAEAETGVRSAELSRLEAGLRPAEIRQASARLAELEASRRIAQQTHERRAALLETQAVSRQSFDESAARLAEATARVAAARNELALAREGFRAEEIEAGRAALAAARAGAGTARTALGDTELRAPSDVVILSRVREPGSIVRAGEPVFTLALERPIWVRAYVSEADLGRVAPGTPAQVFTDTAPDRPYAAQVGFVSPVAEFTPRSVETPDLRSDLVYQIRVIVARPDAGLRQGMPVTVRLQPRTSRGNGR